MHRAGGADRRRVVRLGLSASLLVLGSWLAGCASTDGGEDSSPKPEGASVAPGVGAAAVAPASGRPVGDTEACLAVTMVLALGTERISARLASAGNADLAEMDELRAEFRRSVPADTEPMLAAADIAIDRAGVELSALFDTSVRRGTAPDPVAYQQIIEALRSDLRALPLDRRLQELCGARR